MMPLMTKTSLGLEEISAGANAAGVSVSVARFQTTLPRHFLSLEQQSWVHRQKILNGPKIAVVSQKWLTKWAFADLNGLFCHQLMTLKSLLLSTGFKLPAKTGTILLSTVMATDRTKKTKEIATEEAERLLQVERH